MIARLRRPPSSTACCPDDIVYTRVDIFDRIARVRAARDELRKHVRAGAVSFDEIFEKAEHDSSIATMKLLPLIESIPEVGKVQSRRALAALSIDETIRVCDVPASAHSDLLDLLRGERLASESSGD